MIDVSEGPDSVLWPSLPSHDRTMVGGHTVWVGPFESPVLVAQPNRWGVIESEFPDVPCLVECDPAVVAALDLPATVAGLVDRTHVPITSRGSEAVARALMESARRLAKALEQIKGVRVAARPFARTIPLITPRSPGDVAATCGDLGLVGLRPLPGLGGGVALSVREEHGATELDAIVEVLTRAVSG